MVKFSYVIRSRRVPALGQLSVIRHPPTSWVPPYDESHDTFFLCVGSAVIRAVADGIFVWGI